MRVFVDKPPGYDQSGQVFPFSKSITTYFDDRGIAWTLDPTDPRIDIGLLIQWVTAPDRVRELKGRGIPLVHRLDGRARSLVKFYHHDETNREIDRLADWTVFQSEYVRRHTSEPCDTIFGLEPPICEHPDRASVIYNAVDRRVFRPDGDIERFDEDAEIRVLHAAFSANTRKGVGDLVEYARLLRNNPKIRFYALGRQRDDCVHGHLLEDLPNVVCLGVETDRDRIARIMRSCDLLFFPSRNDYCPNTVIEAMASGLPVIYHDSGGTPELIAGHGIRAGIAMDPNNPVYPLATMIEHLPEFKRRALELVERRFDLAIMGEAYVALFESLLSGRARSAA